MSVVLRCPNCYAIVGEASHEDNYNEKYYYILDGRPICNNCGAGKFRFLSLFRSKKNQYKKNL